MEIQTSLWKIETRNSNFAFEDRAEPRGPPHVVECRFSSFDFPVSVSISGKDPPFRPRNDIFSDLPPRSHAGFLCVGRTEPLCQQASI